MTNKNNNLKSVFETIMQFIMITKKKIDVKFFYAYLSAPSIVAQNKIKKQPHSAGNNDRKHFAFVLFLCYALFGKTLIDNYGAYYGKKTLCFNTVYDSGNCFGDCKI